MSFDLNNLAINKKLFVSIPLEQGNVFRRSELIAMWQEYVVSIPLEQGNVFRRKRQSKL